MIDVGQHRARTSGFDQIAHFNHSGSSLSPDAVDLGDFYAATIEMPPSKCRRRARLSAVSAVGRRRF